MSYTSHSVNAYSTTDAFGYRGFTQGDIILLSAPGGQGEACSKNGATGLFAAIDWIDNFYKLGNTKDGRFYAPHEFNWYGWDKFYSNLSDRSRPGKMPPVVEVATVTTTATTTDAVQPTLTAHVTATKTASVTTTETTLPATPTITTKANN